MKVMFLVPSGTQRSHARFRVIPFVEHACARGMDVFWKAVPLSFLGRCIFFSRLPKADVYVVHRELLSTLELQAVKRVCDRLVYDFSDAVWMLPGNVGRLGCSMGHSKVVWRFERLCRAADLCIVDNRALADRISAWQNEVHVLPTAVDTEAYTLRSGKNKSDMPVVGWIGDRAEPEQLRCALGSLAPEAGSFQFSVVSGRPYAGPGQEYVFWSTWSEERELEQLQTMDVGLVPLDGNEWTRAASGIDVLRYMASGVAVVASGVGSAAEIVDHGIDGFLVRSEADWKRCILRLLEDEPLRQTMVTAAHRKIREEYSVEALAPRLWETLGI